MNCWFGWVGGLCGCGVEFLGCFGVILSDKDLCVNWVGCGLFLVGFLGVCGYDCMCVL